MELMTIATIAAFAPLAGAAAAGLLGWKLGRAFAHTVTIASVAISLVAALVLLTEVAAGNAFSAPLYTWLSGQGWSLHVGFLVDRLTAVMMVVVTFVSLMVHVYTIGYMAGDPGYQRFFAYISLFTFSMLMLVMADNFLQLFFGWEAVGLVSYLLIGFWFKRPTAIYANLKAFLVNRVGDFGFLLGIGFVFAYFGTLQYSEVFVKAPSLANVGIELVPGQSWALGTIICIGLFVGAMGKSAQFPLHVWLPDSMEGPTPISALIHAATMVTAGIFMVARMSPLFELSEAALSFVLVVGATTALFTGLIGIVQNDIKRVVAYSTLSQLGYMTVALGVSAYSAAIFHLMTHAFFKALLFLGAGSVIIAMHHEQDMRFMGGLRKRMPVTYWTGLVGTLALVGTPFFSGFYSKDIIIEAVAESQRAGAGYAFWCVMIGVFVTAFYSFRLLYLTFHGKERYVVAAHDDGHAPDAADAGHDAHHHAQGHLEHAPHESPWVVTVPLVLLAIPSLAIGFLTIGPMLFGDFFQGAIVVREANDVVGRLGHHFHGPVAFALEGFRHWPFWIALAGFAAATWLYLLQPGLAPRLRSAFAPIVRVLENKYGFDDLYQALFARGSLLLGRGFWKGGDVAVIDNGMVNGSAAVVDRVSSVVRWVQSGHLYDYAFAMILGLIALLGFLAYGL